MVKHMTTREARVFWKKHAESHQLIEEDFNMLSPEMKLEVFKKMQECHDAMRNAKRIS